MSGDTTNTDWKNSDLTDSTDRSLITDISETLAYMSSENRAMRRRQKLREELVREYIESKEQPRPALKSWFRKFLKAK